MKNTKKADAAPVLKLAEIEAMKQPDRLTLFQSKDVAAGRIFIELGKLFTSIEANLGKTQKIFPVLQKAGVRKSSVANASQTSRVFKELVLSKLLPEETFDTFTWAVICLLNRAMSGASKRKLSAKEAVELITSCPQTYDEELESIFDHGLTLAEVENEAERVQRAAAVAAQKAIDDAAAVKAAEELKKAAGGDTAGTTPLAAAAPPTPPAPAPAAPTASTPPPVAEVGAPEPEPEPEPAPTPSPAPPAASNPAPVIVEKVTPLPPAATLGDCFEAVDKLEQLAAQLTPENLGVLFDKALVPFMQRIQQSIAESESANAAAAAA